MKIFIVGGTGRVGQSLAKQLLQAGHEVIVGSRHEVAELVALGIKFKKLDLHASVVEIAQVIGQVDAIYFTAGSRGKDLLQSDAFGAVKTMEAAKLNGINRYIMLSAQKSLEPEFWDLEPYVHIKDYYTAKFFADKYLMDSTTLNFTILQPVALVEEKGTGQFASGEVINKTIAIDDVALALLVALEQLLLSKRCFQLAMVIKVFRKFGTKEKISPHFVGRFFF
ncbi:NAD(P)-binding oxidoreductase [Ligilactobacillus equi]|uniref:NAD(P)-binding oxidoreductase n=1 Tax=Ligilactobacillus equi TaxID=137357 RepID=UPI000AF21C33|nr:NAD(P)-binding oxidoreductase [Ligilactobacillus equi]